MGSSCVPTRPRTERFPQDKDKLCRGQIVALWPRYPYSSSVQGLTTLRFEWIQGCFPKFGIPAACSVCRVSWDQTFPGSTIESSA